MMTNTVLHQHLKCVCLFVTFDFPFYLLFCQTITFWLATHLSQIYRPFLQIPKAN